MNFGADILEAKCREIYGENLTWDKVIEKCEQCRKECKENHIDVNSDDNRARITKVYLEYLNMCRNMNR